MVEIRAGHLDVVSCHATQASCDAAMAIGGACRVAPDEVMIIREPGSAAWAVGRVGELVDVHAVVIDATDGWAVLDLGGDDARVAFTYLSALELPDDGFAQGDVANLPAKVLASADGVHVLVPAMLGDELHRRILARCGHLTGARR